MVLFYAMVMFENIRVRFTKFMGTWLMMNTGYSILATVGVRIFLMRVVVVWLFCYGGFGWAVSASSAVWWLEWVHVLSRRERGADETWRYADSGFYDRALEQNRLYQDRLAWRGIDRWWRFAARKAAAEVNDQRNTVMLQLYAQDSTIDSVVTEEDWRLLMWPLRYHHAKDKIVIHHTASSTATMRTKADYMSGVQNIYKFHAHSRWWWDIGYNFVIDPLWNIYEWRAGWAGVVGAHAEWNNTDSIGIALLGNYDEEQPSQAMIDALVRLMTSLSWKYWIALDKEQVYYEPLSTTPWIRTKRLPSFVWHRDIKATACPGTYLRVLMPSIQRSVLRNIGVFRQLWRLDFDAVRIHTVPNTQYFEGNRWTLTVPIIGLGTNSVCNSLAPWVVIRSCSVFPGYVDIHLERRSYPASWRQTVLIQDSQKVHMIEVPLVWSSDVREMRVQKEKEYTQKFWWLSSVSLVQKIDVKLDGSRIPELLAMPARVLLYEITAQEPTWDMKCTAWCIVRLDDQTFFDVRFVNVIKNTAWTLDVYIDTKKHSWTLVHMSNLRWDIEFGNYKRSSFAGIPRNIFRWDITIRKEQYRHLSRWLVTDYTVVNTLPFEQYLRGIAEVSDQEHTEKIKAMVLLVKAYALYYISWENVHPSIPQWASYTMVDDARIFQKYVWAGYEQTAKKWFEALNAVRGEVLTYQNFLPILPYFSCSAWFTWSAQQKRWWTDTPYLVSVLDVAQCKDGNFNGHGVGLSGLWAQTLAEMWASYRDILSYYYSWITLGR